MEFSLIHAVLYISHLWYSGVCEIIIFMNFGKFSATVFSNIFSFITISIPFYTSVMAILYFILRADAPPGGYSPKQQASNLLGFSASGGLVDFSKTL